MELAVGLHAVSGLLLDGDGLAREPRRAPVAAVEAGGEALGQPLGGQQPDEGGARRMGARGDAARARPSQPYAAGAPGDLGSASRGHGQRLHGHGRSSDLALLLGSLEFLQQRHLGGGGGGGGGVGGLCQVVAAEIVVVDVGSVDGGDDFSCC